VNETLKKCYARKTQSFRVKPCKKKPWNKRNIALPKLSGPLNKLPDFINVSSVQPVEKYIEEVGAAILRDLRLGRDVSCIVGAQLLGSNSCLSLPSQEILSSVSERKRKKKDNRKI
jgi:hypothetical protein